eukprot:UN05287
MVKHVFTQKRDKVRLKLILRGKRLGFTLAETGRLFELYDADKSSAKQLVTMLDLISGKKPIFHNRWMTLKWFLWNWSPLNVAVATRLAK